MEPKLFEWHIYGNEQQGRFTEVGYFLPLGEDKCGVLKKMLFSHLK
jgi:hypothetical protein